MIEDSAACEREFFCPVHGAWEQIRMEFMATLSRYDFATLAAEQGCHLPVSSSPTKQ
jgi:DNA-binding IscR family transcriptional regulator